jgi:hypothetical protein
VSVGLVVYIVIELLLLGAEKLLRPVTLLACLLGGAKVFKRGGDRFGINLGVDSVYLIQSGKLGFGVPSGSRPDMAGRTGDPRMGGVLISDILRLHYGMA